LASSAISLLSCCASSATRAASSADTLAPACLVAVHGGVVTHVCVVVVVVVVVVCVCVACGGGGEGGLSNQCGMLIGGARWRRPRSTGAQRPFRARLPHTCSWSRRASRSAASSRFAAATCDRSMHTRPRCVVPRRCICRPARAAACGCVRLQVCAAACGCVRLRQHTPTCAALGAASSSCRSALVAAASARSAASLCCVAWRHARVHMA
jgi:hypothetical protein